MEPTLSHRQYLLVSRLSYNRRAPARGDIVVAHDPGLPGIDCIKRIIGLPGEQVSIEDGCVYINDRPVHEPYLLEEAWSSTAPMRLWLLEEDEYAVLGDNRNDSRDSRRFGSLGREQILGKAWIRYWPPRAWGVIPQQAPSLLR